MTLNNHELSKYGILVFLRFWFVAHILRINRNEMDGDGP